jgi:hypothetical protein
MGNRGIKYDRKNERGRRRKERINICQPHTCTAEKAIILFHKS